MHMILRHGWWWALLCFAIGSNAIFAAEPTRFTILADCRGHQGTGLVFEQFKEAIGESGLFLLTPGDMSPLAKVQLQFDRVFGKPLPWYPVVGNHEASEKDDMSFLRTFYREHLKGQVNPGPAGTEETTYSFDAGPVHIAVINQYWNGKTSPGSDAKTDGDVVPALRDWLRSDLKRSDKPWRLVVGHEPAYPANDRHWQDGRHSGSSLNEHQTNRDAFWKLLEEQDVDAYICGHTHRYSRTQPAGGTVWQIDAAQIRGDDSWKYDTGIVVTATQRSLKFDIYRSMKQRGKFEIFDTLSIPWMSVNHRSRPGRTSIQALSSISPGISGSR